jgi:F-type H+-transporting ATPase subunit c
MKVVKLLALVVILLLLFATPALAQPPSTAPAPTTPNTVALSGAAVGAGIGAGLVLIGAGWGFGRIGAAALDGMSRQPEVAGRVQTAMIIIAALLEGATFFALLVCMLVNNATKW